MSATAWVEAYVAASPWGRRSMRLDAAARSRAWLEALEADVGLACARVVREHDEELFEELGALLVACLPDSLRPFALNGLQAMQSFTAPLVERMSEDQRAQLVAFLRGVSVECGAPFLLHDDEDDDDAPPVAH